MKPHGLLSENKYDQLHLYSSQQMLLKSQLSILLLSAVFKRYQSYTASWKKFIWGELTTLFCMFPKFKQ